MRQEVEVLRPDRRPCRVWPRRHSAPSPTTFTCKFLAELEVSNALFYVYSTENKRYIAPLTSSDLER
jgi:hypothetical protein